MDDAETIPYAGCGPHRRPVQERFWDKVDKRGPNDCWPWTAATDTSGYGRIWDGKRIVPAHRVAYQMLVGPLHPWLVVDHLCENRRCVNPAHLELVPEVVNILRGSLEVVKTHCPQGHPYDDANTIRRRGKRECRTCANARLRRWRASWKAAR